MTKPIETLPNGATIEPHSLYGYIIRKNGKAVNFTKSLKRARQLAAQSNGGANEN